MQPERCRLGVQGVVPDERLALETEIARLQDENATLKKELLAGGLPRVRRVRPSQSPTSRRSSCRAMRTPTGWFRFLRRSGAV